MQTTLKLSVLAVCVALAACGGSSSNKNSKPDVNLGSIEGTWVNERHDCMGVYDYPESGDPIFNFATSEQIKISNGSFIKEIIKYSDEKCSRKDSVLEQTNASYTTGKTIKPSNSETIEMLQLDVSDGIGKRGAYLLSNNNQLILSTDAQFITVVDDYGEREEGEEVTTSYPDYFRITNSYVRVGGGSLKAASGSTIALIGHMGFNFDSGKSANWTLGVDEQIGTISWSTTGSYLTAGEAGSGEGVWLRPALLDENDIYLKKVAKSSLDKVTTADIPTEWPQKDDLMNPTQEGDIYIVKYGANKYAKLQVLHNVDLTKPLVNWDLVVEYELLK